MFSPSKSSCNEPLTIFRLALPDTDGSDDDDAELANLVRSLLKDAAQTPPY
jgi:hypothetical protein